MPKTAQLHRIASKLERLRAIDVFCLFFGADAHRYELNDVISEAEIRSFESAHGIVLPEGYRSFLLEIGDGGAGPDYGLAELQHTHVDWQFSARSLSVPFPLTEPYNPHEVPGLDDDDEEDDD